MGQAQIQDDGPKWSSRFAFLMAAIGSSVGLGNFWRFPYTAGEGGGGVFVIVYLLCVVFVAYPILVSEYAIGRHSAISAVGSFENLARDSKRTRYWGLAGWIGMIASFMILITYCLIAGDVLAYIIPSFKGSFKSIPFSEVGSWYDVLTHGSSLTRMFYQVMFIGFTVFIVARGLGSGIELAAQILMPIFFLMFIFLIIYAMFAGNFMEAVVFLFKPDWKAFTFKSALSALGQSFFSIGIGVGLMITYGSYLSKETNIGRSAVIVAGSDTLVAIIAGLTIFPFVFAYGLSPDGGPGLFFKVLPSAFSQMAFGQYLSGAFFIFAFFAALTSSIALLEVSVAYLVERTKLSRIIASILCGIALWLIGGVCIYTQALFKFFDKSTSLFLLPVGGLLVTLFVGWAIKPKIMKNELRHMSNPAFNFWLLCSRYIAPIGVLLILIFGILTEFKILEF